jgi:ferric-dicitrate binding protein FerR (iron transport regulator)
MHRAQELIQKHLDQVASAAELAELDQLVSNSPEAVDRFVAAGRMDLLLEEYAREAVGRDVLGTNLPAPAARSARSGRRILAAGLAAAVLLVAAGLTVLLRVGRTEMTPYGVVWGHVLVDGAPAEWIPDGSRVEVAGETAAVIRLADGSQAELAPETAVVLHGRGGRVLEMELDRGGGKFQVGREGRRLRVETPAGTITARGTEFNLELRPEDAKGGEPMNDKVAFLLAVAVMAGNVEVRSKDQSYVLASGETGLFSPQKPGGGKIPMLTGKVSGVSDDGKRLTIETPPPKPGVEPQQHDVQLSDQTTIIYFGVEKGADRPTVGYRATAILDVDKPETATRVEFGVKDPQITGRVTAVSADGTVLMLEVYRKGQKPAQMEVRLTDRTRLSYSGVEKEGEKPTEGYLAQVWLKEGSSGTAAEVRFVVKNGKSTGAAEPARLAGTIKAVSPDGMLIKLETPAKVKGGEPAIIDIKLTDRTKLLYFGVDREGEKLTVGYLASVSLENGTKNTAASIKLGLKDKSTPRPTEKPKVKKTPEPGKGKTDKEKKGEPPVEPVKARPQPPARDPRPLAAAIDREVNQRLTEAKIPPSPLADDAEFLRRVTIDITGHIPSHEQTVAFLASSDPEKRCLLIDELLAEPDHGRHYGTVWRSLMVPREAAKGGKPQADHLSPWLADQFNQGRGWQQIVHDLLTVEGDVAQNPQAGFIMANAEGFHPQADRLAASAARLFLGVQLQCAQCHNHPFTGWKQDDFWGMAAFFSRVRNSGKKGPPFILTEAPDAELPAKTKKGAPSPPPTALNGAIVIPTSAGKASGKVVKAKLLDGAEPALDGQGPYRPIFAAWVTAPTNPYFANAAVNRLWSQFFGRGLVNPVDNFHPDNPPSHPALLKLLADEFTSTGGDLKHLIRGLCNSQAYQRSSCPLSANEADVQLFSHMAVKVMSPEVFYDSLVTALAAGPALGGKGTKLPGGKKGLPNLASREQFVQFFSAQGDAAETGESSHGIPQFLKLMNAEQFNRSAPIVERLVQTEVAHERAIDDLYLSALSRRPRADEIRLMSDYLAKRSDPRSGFAGVLWILLNSSEFVLNH